jgi:hypothetical protein
MLPDLFKAHAPVRARSVTDWYMIIFPNGIKPLGKLSYTNQLQTAHARERAL